MKTRCLTKDKRLDGFSREYIHKKITHTTSPQLRRALKIFMPQAAFYMPKEKVLFSYNGACCSLINVFYNYSHCLDYHAIGSKEKLGLEEV